MSTRRTALVVIAVAALLAGVGFVKRADISLRVAQKLADRRLAAQPLAGLGDGLHVGLCGAGSPLPDPHRSGPCTVVIAGQRMFLVDAGSAASRNLVKMGFNPGDIEALFLTHFHSDHIDGLGEVMLQRWAGGSHTDPLPVYGPTGVEGVVAGFMQAYAPDEEYRVAHHGPAGGPARRLRRRRAQLRHRRARRAGRAAERARPRDRGVRRQSRARAPGRGYRIRYKDRTVVLSGDTIEWPAVEREARGVDLLVHEALSVPLVANLQRAAEKAGKTNIARIFADIPGYHTTPEQAAGVARDAGVGFLLLNHIVPALPLPGMEAAFLGESGSIFQGPIRVGVDGDFISLPAGSKAIEVGRRE